MYLGNLIFHLKKLLNAGSNRFVLIYAESLTVLR